MFNVALCDPDRRALDLMETEIRTGLGDDYNVTKHGSVFSLLTQVEDISHGNVNIVVLDANMNDRDALDAASQLRHFYPHIQIIFTATRLAPDQDIFDCEPAYLIVKPINRVIVAKAVSRAIDRVVNLRETSFIINNKGKITLIPYEKILYFESDRRIVRIYQRDIISEVWVKMDDVEKVLPANFGRCHQSYIVNMDLVASVSVENISLRSGAILPVSRSRFNDFRDRFLAYCSTPCPPARAGGVVDA